jgi:hypothetical protein
MEQLLRCECLAPTDGGETARGFNQLAARHAIFETQWGRI